MGLPADYIDIVVATDLMGDYLLQNYGRKTVKVVGSAELKNSLKSYGHTVLELKSHQLCEYVIVGRDLEFTYNKLLQCCKAIKNGAKLAAPNRDLNHPGLDGMKIPETWCFACSN